MASTNEQVHDAAIANAKAMVRIAEEIYEPGHPYRTLELAVDSAVLRRIEDGTDNWDAVDGFPVLWDQLNETERYHLARVGFSRKVSLRWSNRLYRERKRRDRELVRNAVATGTVQDGSRHLNAV